ncbi:MAG: DNA-methyltransferase [Thermomicrobiales bacterium]
MTPYYEQDGVVVHLGDCREVLAQMPSESIQTCVTSPPYFGLRSYLPTDHTDKANEIGLEPTVDLYVAEMVAVFREVRRVLKDDGSLWLVLGDSYANNGISQPQRDTSGGFSGRDQGTRGKQGYANASGAGIKLRVPQGLKPKDLIGIPWRVAFALQAEGWYLRQDIIWAKNNPMPESVTDRCTKAHEYIFLLTKNARYYYNAAAIAETSVGPGRIPGGNHKVDASRNDDGRDMSIPVGITRNKRSVWTVTTKPFSEAHFATFPPALIEPCILAGSRPGDVVLDPFMGSGTTGEVSQHLERKFIGIELNPEYIPMAIKRMSQPALGLFSAQHAYDTTDKAQSDYLDDWLAQTNPTLERVECDALGG